MSLFKSGNPTLQENKFTSTVLDGIVLNENAMTVKGTLQKFGFLCLMVIGTSVYSWREFSEGGNAMPLIIGGAIAGFVIAMVKAIMPPKIMATAIREITLMEKAMQATLAAIKILMVTRRVEKKAAPKLLAATVK